MLICDNYNKVYTTSKRIKNAITWKPVFRRKSSFLSKLDLAEAIIDARCCCDFKINRKGSTKWTITKNRVLPVATLFLRKLCFSLRNSYKELIWCTNRLNTHIYTFLKCCGFYLRFLFPCEYPQTTNDKFIEKITEFRLTMDSADCVNFQWLL